MHPTEGAYVEMRPPVRYAAAPDLEGRPPPLIGQDSEAIRAELAGKT
jgi:crotonobetainyl-CoA:carnitine CoA-transferase CaiB-like acyl-CoA transferase